MRFSDEAYDNANLVPYSGDPLLHHFFVNGNITPIQFGLITLAVGFGGMLIFHLVMTYTNDPAMQLRNLFGYLSSSIGDPVLLPFMSVIIAYSYKGISAAFMCLDKRDIKYAQAMYSRRIWLIMTIFLSGLGVMGFHVLAIFGSGRNWTLPEYGRINLAGIYHGLFMWFYLYVVIGYGIRQILTVYLIRRYSTQYNLTALWKTNSELLLVLLSIIGVFGGLLSADRLASDSRWFNPLLVIAREATVVANWIFGFSIICIMHYLDLRMHKMLDRKLLFFGVISVIFMPIVTIYVFYVIS